MGDMENIKDMHNINNTKNKMRYFAPLEGITRFVYRNAFAKYYGGVDKYFAPFMSPAEPYLMTKRERDDLIPEHNKGLYLVPQILTNSGKLFGEAAADLIDMGYKEINLNVGCPSGVVCSKGKGAGMLKDPDFLCRELDKIYDFAAKNDIKVSVKTRIGWSDDYEWEDIFKVYNKFPIHELIIHPRVRQDFYKGEVRMNEFYYALEESKNPIIYNGDITELSQLLKFEADERISGVMMGRGLLRNPGMLTGSNVSFMEFHNELLQGYEELMDNERNVLYPMKELWNYWKCGFQGKDAEVKRILMSKTVEEYRTAVGELCEEVSVPKTVSTDDGLKAFYKLREEAKVSGIQDMSLDDINAEIKAYRNGE